MEMAIMTSLIRYLSPVWRWVLLWWLVFSGSLYAFVENAAGGMLSAWFEQLHEQLGSWSHLIGWVN